VARQEDTKGEKRCREKNDADGAEFVAFVGFDWADQKHAWCLQAAGSTQREYGELEHKPETVEV
jgi:hypothetical protein